MSKRAPRSKLHAQVACGIEGHRKVRELALELGDPEPFRAVGVLAVLWTHGAREADGAGVLAGWTRRSLAAVLGGKATADAVIACGFVHELEVGLQLHDFADWTGSAVDRIDALTSAARERKRKQRDKGVTESDVTRDTSVTEPDVTRDMSVTHTPVTALDKMRLDKDPSREVLDTTGAEALEEPPPQSAPPPKPEAPNAARLALDARVVLVWDLYRHHSGARSSLPDEAPEAVRFALARAAQARPSITDDELRCAVLGLCRDDWWMGRARNYEGKAPTKLRALTKLLEDAGRPIDWGVWVDSGRAPIVRPGSNGAAPAASYAPPEDDDPEAARAAMTAMREAAR